jgi:hypothetical protein
MQDFPERTLVGQTATIGVLGTDKMVLRRIVKKLDSGYVAVHNFWP